VHLPSKPRQYLWLYLQVYLHQQSCLQYMMQYLQQYQQQYPHLQYHSTKLAQLGPMSPIRCNQYSQLYCQQYQQQYQTWQLLGSGIRSCCMGLRLVPAWSHVA
jgi:hypothetical protein